MFKDKKSFYLFFFVYKNYVLKVKQSGRTYKGIYAQSSDLKINKKQHKFMVYDGYLQIITKRL